MKEVGKKIAERAMKGQIADMISIPAPAYIHHYTSHLNLEQNDLTQCRFLLKAAAESDPVERMKHILTFYISA